MQTATRTFISFIRPFAASLLLVAPALACGEVPEDAGAVESVEQDLVMVDPILGHLPDTTPGPDFHAEELVPLQFPNVWAGADFPRSTAIPGTLGTSVTLPPGRTVRSVAYTFTPGADIEICVQSPAAKPKLWLYTTKTRYSASCSPGVCNDPDELDETPRAKSVGDKVCTRGRIPKDSWAPHYVVVDLGSGSTNATATVTTKAIKLRDKVVVDPAPFAKTCQGATVTVADIQAKGLSQGELSPSVGTFDTAARKRVCNRFRGCTPWQSVDTSTLLLHGSCSGCIPREWTNAAQHGSVHVAYDDVSFGPYAKVMLYPGGTSAAGPAVTTNHVSCDLSLSYFPTCSAAGDWDNWLTVEGAKLVFSTASESAFTKSCMWTVARQPKPEHYSEFDDTEVVFHAALSP